ncbi:MAG: PstS family phosphate ABC transporter substrate-binding protein [Cyanobacteria bacterium P01_D01_bin.44]
MSQSKNEIPALVAALGITAAVIGGAIWWLKDSSIFGGSGPSSGPATQTNPQTNPQINTQPNNPPRAGQTNLSTFAEVPNVPSGQFEYGGSTTWAPVRGAVDPLIQQALPNFNLIYKDAPSQAPGSSVGIQMLIQGELDFAQSSRPLNSSEQQQAQQQGLTLQETPVAIEAVAIATHPKLSIPGLTLEQLKNIYTGQLTNWNQVGGPNLTIVPTARGDVGGTVQFFQESVLEGQAFTTSVQTLPSTTAALRFVGDTPGSIYFASAPEVVGQCTVAPVPIGTSQQQLVPPYQEPYVPPADCPTRRNQLNLNAFQGKNYPLTRPLYVVSNSNPQSEQAGLAYTRLLQTEEGQRLLKQAGFVPLP